MIKLTNKVEIFNYDKHCETKYVIMVGSEKILLTTKAFQLLQLLVNKKEITVSDSILIWPNANNDTLTRNFNNTMFSLRKQLGKYANLIERRVSTDSRYVIKEKQ